MRVLMWMISSGNAIQGGHQIQVQQTANHLEALGVRTRIAYEQNPDLGGIDVVHNFGLDPHHIRRCHERGIPVVTSTIYWERGYALGIPTDRGGLKPWMDRARMALVLARSALRGVHVEKCEAVVKRQSRLRVVYEMSDVLLPNSQSEADAIMRELNVSAPYHVVPNSVDPTIFKMPAEDGVERKGVLYATRFEPHKNPLGLIQAMRGSDIPVHIIGFAHPHHERYMAQCRAAAARTKHITIGPPQAPAELARTYQKARVHALPSWFETTGLVSLEAALCGCNVVTTGRGFARDYFGDLAWYCDPAKPATIRTAIEAAYESPAPVKLRERILANYTWERTAEETLRGYETVLANGARARVSDAAGDVEARSAAEMGA